MHGMRQGVTLIGTIVFGASFGVVGVRYDGRLSQPEAIQIDVAYSRPASGDIEDAAILSWLPRADVEYLPVPIDLVELDAATAGSWLIRVVKSSAAHICDGEASADNTVTYTQLMAFVRDATHASMK